MSMTREEAIDYIKNLKMYMKISDKNNRYKFLEENYIALDVALEALKVCDELCENLAWYINERNRLLKEQRPHGEWVWKLDEETGESGWNCPVCNEFGDCKSPYCPNCGADMRKEGGEK